MKIGFFLFAAVFLTFLQCSENKNLNPQSSENKNLNLQKVIKKDFPNVAVFEYSSKENFWAFKEGTPTALNNDEIDESLKILEKAVEEYNKNPKLNRQVDRIDSYNLQFLPVLNAKNEKEVWINALCQKYNREEDRWKKSPLLVSDGGNCYFNVYVNLTNKTSQKISVNGEA